MHQYIHDRLFGEILEDEISDFLGDDLLEVLGIFEAAHIVAEGVVEEVLDLVLEPWELGEFRDPVGDELEEVAVGFLGDTHHDRTSDRELVAVMEGVLSGIPDHIPVHGCETVGDKCIGNAEAILGKLDNLSIFPDDDLVIRVSEVAGIARVPVEHEWVSVDRHVDLWADQRDHLLGVFFLGMSSCMDAGFFVLAYTGSLRHDDVEESLNGSLVTGDDRGAEYDSVVCFEGGIVRFSGGDAHEGGVAFPLGSGTTDGYLVIWELARLLHGDEGSSLWSGVSELDRDLHVVIHPASEQYDLAAKFLARRDDEDDTIDDGRKSCRDDTTARSREDIIDGSDDFGLGDR